MSCIDAAIIKALVEHIGMDPEDVGSAHGDIPIDVIWNTYTADNGYNYYLIEYPDFVNGRVVKAGDIIVMEKKSEPGTFIYWYCACAGVLSNFQFIGGVMNDKVDFVRDGATIKTTILVDDYTPVGLYQINTIKSLQIGLAALSNYTYKQLKNKADKV